MEPVGLASDSTSLDSLRRDAAKDPKKAVRTAANEFEALFTRQLLKSMRDAMPRSGLFDGPGQSTYESMLDDQLARNIAGQRGGLGDMLADHLARYMAPADQDQIALNTSRAKSSETNLASGGLNIANDPRISMNMLPSALRSAMSSESVGGASDASSRPSEFVSRMWPHARLAEQATGVRAEFVIGQAALESGWGRGEMKFPDGSPAHNLFGIKAGTSWQGNTIDVTTTEYIDGKKTRRVETFRAYNSYAESFNDWAELMKRLPRYAEVISSSATPQQFADGLQDAGYATDPRYGEKLQQVIEQAIAIRRTAG